MATFTGQWRGSAVGICDNRRVSDFTVTDNPARHRYELRVDGRIVSIADYELTGDKVVLVPHVETDPEMRGRGMGDRLMRGMLDDMHERGLRITPICPFAAAYVRSHPADHNLLA